MCLQRSYEVFLHMKEQASKEQDKLYQIKILLSKTSNQFKSWHDQYKYGAKDKETIYSIQKPFQKSLKYTREGIDK